tara:strand:- start:5191 stop:5358 length:168 start_codon:yes stop_codon:yes gene_type:complete
MKRFIKEHGWYVSMVAGIGLLMSTVTTDSEYFYGQTILASVLILSSLLLEGANKK